MILITGARGFIGRALIRALEERGRPVRGTVRQGARGSEIAIGDIGPNTDWTRALKGASTVIHTAGLVHLRGHADEAIYHAVNVIGSNRLAEQAARTGVRRLIFISSVKVYGDTAKAGTVLAADTAVRPLDPYGRSKLAAEQALYATAVRTGLELTIIRPPLIYGPGVKANFLALLTWLYRRVPLPLGAINNRRSLLALGNLSDLIATCIDHPAAAGRSFIVSDGEDLSTTDLLLRLGWCLGRRARLFSIPTAILRAGMIGTGRRGLADRLLGSLQIDMGETQALLDWRPPLTVDQGLRLVADWYLSERRNAGARAAATGQLGRH